MTIEIRELVIRARIEPGCSKTRTQQTARKNNTAKVTKTLTDDLMRILKDKGER